MGSKRYPQAQRLLITADAGGSNGSRLRLWKTEIQKLANQMQMTISICHFPPGTSKWNKIEHRLFSFISQNWRGKPLISHAVIVKLITATRTKTGLKSESTLGHELVSRWNQGQQSRYRRRQATTRFISWRLELHDLTYDSERSTSSQKSGSQTTVLV
jgi:hypothetical protein